MIRVFHINAGSSGSDDRVLVEAIRRNRLLCWSDAPEHADIFVLTGPLTQAVRPALLRLWRDFIAGRAPLVAFGKECLDGLLSGPGGISDLPELQAAVTIPGDPPELELVGEVLARTARDWRPAPASPPPAETEEEGGA